MVAQSYVYDNEMPEKKLHLVPEMANDIFFRILLC